MQVEILPVESLRLYPRNARTHSKKQIRLIADSILRFGFCNPVLIEGSRRRSHKRQRRCTGPNNCQRCSAGVSKPRSEVLLSIGVVMIATRGRRDVERW
jgi:hypothetical protein